MLEAVDAAKPNAREGSGNAPVLNMPDGRQNREINLKAPQKKLNVAAEVRKVARKKIERIAQALDSYMQSIQRDLKIGVHQATGNIMVKVVSKSDGKIIREIPPEELLDLAAKMEEMIGVLVNENA
ncbi:MAG: flagellar protein FlaG [Deltaproteobacteria bacterium]|nr:flagellar protein FlaG [Deltaproteobacteria bacterium]